MLPRDALLRCWSDSSAPAQTGPGSASVLQSVKLALISEGMSTTWPLYVAQAHQLFEREGLRIQVTLTGSSVKQLEALKSGAFDIGFQQVDHVVRAVEKGSDLFIFMPLAHAPELTLVAAPQIRTFSDLKRCDIAVDGARSGYALLLRRLLASKGLAETDYRLVEIGGSQERYEALRSGIAMASLLNSPFDQNLFALGFGSLGTTAEHFPGYVGPAAAARRSWARDNSRTLVAFIRAMTGAYDWMLDGAHRAEAITILRSRLNVAADEAGRAFDRYATLGRPGITDQGLQQVIDIVWDVEGFALPRAAPGKFVDWSYLNAARS